MQAAAGRALFWCALAVCICTAVQLRRPVGAPGHAGEVCSRSRSCSVGRGQRCVMRIRGGQPDEGLGGDVICSTAVSDRGLLESPQDGSIDLSVLEELREESMMRLSKMCDAEIGAMLHKRKRGMLEEEGKILQQKLHGSRSMPFPFPEIDYAANVGVNVSSLRSQQPRAHPGGVRLRECDEALLQEEDELYEAARKGDPAGAQKVDLENFYSADPRMQKQRRLARIKALLRCKAAAMTSEVMDQQALDGVEIPVFEMGNEQQRKNLRKLRDLFHPRSPSPEPPLSLRGATAHLKKCMPENESCVLHVRAEQGPLAGSPETQAEARTHPGTTPRLHQNTSAQQYGPYTPMEHPYLVVRGPNSSTLLYECEQGDLDEGLRIEGVRRVPRGLNENAPLHNVAVNGVDGWEGVEDRAGEAYKDKSDAGVLRARGKWKVMNMTLQTELMEAAEYGDYDGLSRALECGANLETGHNTPYTVSALHLAARGNHLGVIQLLLQHGQDANCEDYALATPLHYACDRGCLEAVQLLLCAGANLSRTDCYGRTALHRAAVEAPRRVARLLVDAGAHVDARDLLLDSPLHVAAIWGNEGVARLLVSHGARGDDFNRFGHCPVVLADTWERIVVAKFLRDHLRQIGAPEGYLSHMKPLRRPDELSVTPGFDREVAGPPLCNHCTMLHSPHLAMPTSVWLGFSVSKAMHLLPVVSSPLTCPKTGSSSRFGRTPAPATRQQRCVCSGQCWRRRKQQILPE